MHMTLKLLFLIGLLRNFVVSLPEQGKWAFELTQDHQSLSLTKTIHANSEIKLRVTCNGNTSKNVVPLRISYSVRRLTCYRVIEADYQPNTASAIVTRLDLDNGDDIYPLTYAVAGPYRSQCDNNIIIPAEDKPLVEEMLPKTGKTLDPHDKNDHGTETTVKSKLHQEKAKKKPEKPSEKQTKDDAKIVRRSPEDENADPKKESPGSPSKEVKDPKKDDASKKETDTAETTTTTSTAAPAVTPASGPVPSQYRISRDGIFLITVTIEPGVKNESYTASVELEIVGPYGYLSAVDWPLLPFFGSMCVVYFAFGVAWLVVLALQWQDLLRIQFWIGGVIILGMIEKAVLYAEYQSLNNTGSSVQGVMIFAELVSCVKRTLARMLVIIVSFGFGIVKPRLGTMLHRVVGIGICYFLFCSAEGIFHIIKPQHIPNRAYLVQVPLTVLDTAICWWIFSNLVQTTRTLRLRRNVVKLSLYRHFTNTLAFACIASVAFMIWVIRAHRMTDCITDWKELWVDIAYWHLLFSVILLVIMVLWRPTNNNQRYAFVPLIDALDDEDDEQMTNDAFEGMKARNSKSGANSSQRDKDALSKAKAEDDLAWVEENIPASLADAALPSLLDSDEEIMNTKFEMSKME